MMYVALRPLWPPVSQVDEQDQLFDEHDRLFQLPLPADIPHIALRHDAQVWEIRAGLSLSAVDGDDLATARDGAAILRPIGHQPLAFFE